MQQLEMEKEEKWRNRMMIMNDCSFVFTGKVASNLN